MCPGGCATLRRHCAQLHLSSHARYLQGDDCGHNVVRDRPDVVVEKLKWVLANLGPRPAARGNDRTRIEGGHSSDRLPVSCHETRMKNSCARVSYCIIPCSEHRDRQCVSEQRRI